MAATGNQSQSGESIWNQIPQYILENCPKMTAVINGFTDCKTVLNIREYLDPVLEVAQCLRPEKIVDLTKATELVNNCVDHETITKNSTALIKQMCSEGECSEHLMKVVTNALRDTADRVLKSAAFFSCVHLLSTFIAIYDLSKELENADNLGTETKAEIGRIRNLLKEVPAKLEEWTEILKKMQKENIGRQEMNRLNNEQKLKASSIESILQNAETRIENVIQRNQAVRVALERSRQGANNQGFNGIVSGISNMYNAHILKDVASPSLVGVNAGIGIFNICVGGIAIAMAHLAKNKIDVIVAHMNNLRDLKIEVDKYRRELNEKKQKIVDLLFEFAQYGNN